MIEALGISAALGRLATGIEALLLRTTLLVASARRALRMAGLLVLSQRIRHLVRVLGRTLLVLLLAVVVVGSVVAAGRRGLAVVVLAVLALRSLLLRVSLLVLWLLLMLLRVLLRLSPWIMEIVWYHIRGWNRRGHGVRSAGRRRSTKDVGKGGIALLVLLRGASARLLLLLLRRAPIVLVIVGHGGKRRRPKLVVGTKRKDRDGKKGLSEGGSNQISM